MEKPSLCPYNEVCRESENHFQRCSECINSDYQSYYQKEKINNKALVKAIGDFRKRIVSLENPPESEVVMPKIATLFDKILERLKKLENPPKPVKKPPKPVE